MNTELQDVQRIMVQNIDDVLQRGAVLSELENKSQNLTEMSRKYKKDAESLNATSLAVIAGIVILHFFHDSCNEYYLRCLWRWIPSDPSHIFLDTLTVATELFQP